MTVRVTIPRNKLEVATQPIHGGLAHDDQGHGSGESRHNTTSRDNGGVVTGERRRVHQRTPAAHDRDANNERTPSAPPLRSVGRAYTGNETDGSPGSALPAQLVSNGLSLGGSPPAARVAPATPPPRPTPAPEPRPQTSAGLPTRIPGTSFNETSQDAPTSVRSEMSPDGIKDALSAFQVGREIADPSLPRTNPSQTDGKHTDPRDLPTRSKPEDGAGS